jgi:ribosomal protein L24
MKVGDRVVVIRGPQNGLYGTLVDVAIVKNGGHPIVQLDDGICVELANWHMIELAELVPAMRRINADPR